MPYKIPNIPTFTLKGVDAKIQELQVILGDNLSWLGYSFGLCEHATRKENGEVIRYPAQWSTNKTDYMDLRPFPNDTYSYAFWDIEDPAEVVYDEGMQVGKRKFAHYRYTVACIVVVDINQIDNSSTFNETKSKLRQDIINVFETKTDMIKFTSTFWITGIYEHDIIQIFKGFNINKPEEWKFPYQAFRIEGQLSFKRACPVSNTYTIA